jgi:hypothetical protein
MGLTAHSAFQTLEYDDPEGWKAVQENFQKPLKAANANILRANQLCKDELTNNVEVNVNRIFIDNPNLDNASAATAI